MTTMSQQLHIFTYCFLALHSGSDILIAVKGKNMFNICFLFFGPLAQLRWISNMSQF